MSNQRMTVLIVDDSESDNNNLKQAFPGHSVTQALNLKDAIRKLDAAPDIVVLDAFFPMDESSEPTFMAGKFLDALEEICEGHPQMHPEIILVSGHEQATSHFVDIDEWLDSRRIGAVSAKGLASAGWPFFQAVLRRTANDLQEIRNLRTKYKDVDDACESLSSLGIVTCDPVMAPLLPLIRSAAGVRVPVLILGETGTGKGLVAKTIHDLSFSSSNSTDSHGNTACPWIVADAARIREVPESQLFGHEKGSFTGAIAQHIGFFEAANGGTLFIDEIGDMPKEIQGMILRAIENQEILRLGSTKLIKINTRVVAATDKDLRQLTTSGEFRPQLYERLNVLTIHLPPLRDRRKDIPRLADEFLGRFNKEYHKTVSLSHDLRRAVESGPWVRNIRALQNFIERLVVNCNGVVSLREACSYYKDDEIRDMLDIVTSERAMQPDTSVTPDLKELYLEIKYPPASTWKALGRNEKVDSQNEERLLELLSTLFTPDSQDLLRCLKEALHARQSSDGKPTNSPRRIHHYLALLYLVLSDKHEATISDLKSVLAIEHWGYLNLVGKVLTQISAEPCGHLVTLSPANRPKTTESSRTEIQSKLAEEKKRAGGRGARIVFYLNQEVLTKPTQTLTLEQ